MQAFVVSFVVTVLLTLVAVPFGKRRPVGKPLSWGDAMAAAVYCFFVMFLAYGVVPHQWLTWVQNELGWRADKALIGPGGILKPQSRGGWFPFDINWLQIGDLLVVHIYVFFVALQCIMWAKWQRRGKNVTTEVATSTYGRPLVKKA
jgi:hypothetical protein